MMELSKFPLDKQVCTMEIASCKLYTFIKPILPPCICCKSCLDAFLTSSFCFHSIVSKTTKELVLRWKDDGAPIDISDEVKMPQFEIFKIVDTRCQETMHIGN